MIRDARNHSLQRRRFIKLAGATSIGLGGLASSGLAKKGGVGNNGRGKQPLEQTPSFVSTVVFPQMPPGNFVGFPENPPIKSFDPGVMFDTTSATSTPHGKTLHYQLQFGTDSKPYILRHDGNGRYTSRGATINFEITPEQEPNPLLNPLGLDEGNYRATVRDIVQLYEQGGSFDWSVTRTDVFTLPRMDYLTSFLIIVWDEDGADNNDDADGGFPLNDQTYRNDGDIGDPLDPTDDDVPEFSSDVLGGTYDDIVEAASEFISAGVSNPGGK